MRIVTVLGVNGPVKSPMEPAVIISAATVGGVSLTAAATGIITATMIAFPPAMVPRAPQMRIDEMTIPSLTRV